MRQMTAVELCAGAGGQALGLERAGFHHTALVDPHCCNTLRSNRGEWNVIEQDLREFDGRPYKGVDLLAGGLPCPPFSVAGKQLGDADERNLFPEGIRLVKELQFPHSTDRASAAELEKKLPFLPRSPRYPPSHDTFRSSTGSSTFSA